MSREDGSKGLEMVAMGNIDVIGETPGFKSGFVALGLVIVRFQFDNLWALRLGHGAWVVLPRDI